MQLVDTHCHVHFHPFDEDRELVLERYGEAGGQWLVAVAVDLEDVPQLFALMEEKTNVYCSVGVHPNHELEVEPTALQLCELAAHPKCVAIGETGMDFFRHHVDKEIQEMRFRIHIQAAKRMNKPVIVHMREADADTMRILEGEGADTCGGVMHCFSSTWEIAGRALDMGMSISFSGNITFKRNERLREVVARIPEEALLIETDAPYLTPVPHRGKRNEPGFVRHVAECIADVRGTTAEYIAGLTCENARRRFAVAL